MWDPRGTGTAERNARYTNLLHFTAVQLYVPMYAERLAAVDLRRRRKREECAALSERMYLRRREAGHAETLLPSASCVMPCPGVPRGAPFGTNPAPLALARMHVQPPIVDSATRTAYSPRAPPATTVSTVTALAGGMDARPPRAVSALSCARCQAYSRQRTSLPPACSSCDRRLARRFVSSSLCRWLVALLARRCVGGSSLC